jgi:hypothetical protein
MDPWHGSCYGNEDAADDPAAVLCTAVSALVAVLALPRGQISERYGAWDRWVR